jgi:vanillate O-demethylase ferredoxin subunit
MLYLDAYTGDVLRFAPYAQSSLGHKAYFWTLSWHTGLVGGLFGPALQVSGALALLFLAWSGVSSFVRRSLRKARRT